MFKHRYIMTVKTITITENAYEKIKRLKRENESFSELFLRLSGEKRSTARSMYGILKDVDTEKLLERTKKMRKEFDKETGKRENVFTRQLSGNRASHSRKKK